MADDPRMGNYLEELGYNPYEFTPLPSVQSRGLKPHEYARKQALTALANVFGAAMNKRTENKNKRAAAGAQQTIADEDAAQFQTGIEKLNQLGLTELAAASKVAGKLPTTEQIAKAMKERREEDAANASIAQYQSLLPTNLPMENVPKLSGDYGMPEGPQSIRPETAREMAGQTGNEDQLLSMIKEGRESGATGFDYVQSFTKPRTAAQQFDVYMRNINAKYQSGEYNFDEAAVELDRALRVTKGKSTPEEGLSLWSTKTAISSDIVDLRQQRNQIAGAYTNYLTTIDRQWEKYQKELSIYNNTVKNYPGLAKLNPKPEEPDTKQNFEQWLKGDRGQALATTHSKGYKSYVEELNKNKTGQELQVQMFLDQNIKNGVTVDQVVEDYMAFTADYLRRSVTLKKIAEAYGVTENDLKALMGATTYGE